MLLRWSVSDQPRDRRYLGALLFDRGSEFDCGAAARNLPDGREPLTNAVLGCYRADVH